MRSRAFSLLLFTLLFLSILALAGCGSTARASLAPPLVFPTSAAAPSGPAPLSVYISASGPQSATITALNAQSGGRRWQYQSETATRDIYLDNSVVYFGAADGKVYALDAGSGTVKWSQTISPGAFPSVITVTDGILYAAILGYNPYGRIAQPAPVYALNVSDGSIKWTSQTTGFFASIDSDTIYLTSTDNQVDAVNMSDGSLKWFYRADNVPTIWGIANGQVYLISGPTNQGGQFSAFYALNASDGTAQWRFPTGKDNTAVVSIAVGSDTLYLEANTATGPQIRTANTIFALNPTDGSTRWQTTLQGSLYTATLIDGTLYATSGDRRVYALNPQDGSQLWNTLAGNSTPAIEGLDNGILYVAALSDGLYALNAADGSQRWHDQSDQFIGVYGIVNGVVYTVSIPTQNPSEHSTVSGLNPADGSTLWSYDAGTATITAAIG